MKTLLLSALAALLGWSRQEPPIRELVERLGSDEVEKRDQAARELVRRGKGALEALRAAEKSGTPDVRQRARELIDEIDWPDPGAAVDGLALAVKSDAEYSKDGQILLRGRLANVSEQDVVVAGARAEEVSEGGAFHLRLDGGDSLYHYCYRRAEPAPDFPARWTLKKGERKSFTFSPRAWCALIEHSKCGPFRFDRPASHRLSLVLILVKKGEGEWKGRLESNEVSFRVQ